MRVNSLKYFGSNKIARGKSSGYFVLLNAQFVLSVEAIEVLIENVKHRLVIQVKVSV